MAGDDDLEIMDVLKTTDIKVEGTETKLDELFKQLGVKGASSLDEKLKAYENLTTGATLNGKEKWEEVLKNVRDECIHRRSKFVEPTFYFELKFLLQMAAMVDMDKKDKVVYGIKGRLKLLSMAYRIGWKAVYSHFEIDYKAKGETRKKVEQVFGEELDSDIEITNYKPTRPYTYGYSRPKNNKKP